MEFKEIFLSAQNGYIPAYYELAKCYHYGDGVDRSEEKAVEWYTEAADEGVSEAIDAIMEYAESEAATAWRSEVL